MVTRSQNPLLQLVPQRVQQTKAQVSRQIWERSQVLAVRGGPVRDKPTDVTRARRQRWSDVPAGEEFGPPGGGWQQRWFRVDVPAAGRSERGRRFLQWDCQGETTAFIDGEPWAGLDIAHKTCPLPDRAVTVWLDCSTWQTGIWPPGVHPGTLQIGRYGLRFDGCSLRLRHTQAWDVSWDLDVLVQLLDILLKADEVKSTGGFGFVKPIDSCAPLLRLLLRGLDDACDAHVDEGLGGLQRALRQLFQRLPAEAWQPVAALCGHAHLDLVWLWPEMATERKGVHTFATQLRLLERYPELVFVQSQPALYRAVERCAPTLMPQIRRYIRNGRWEVMGGFEVEPDNNLPCGEALARCLVLGQQKIRELSGAFSQVCWLPDVFGYSAALPQILRLGGIEHFFTTKMTWSQVTKFPYNSFLWRGHDGSEVLAHLCPTNYNGTVDLQDVGGAARDHRQVDVHAEVLLPTGYGDGGGGVTEAMCERARRIGSLAGVPRARWTTTHAFFQRLQRVRRRLPVYQGELYLEYHRGTLTTQSEHKRLYRAAEAALQTEEAARVACGQGPLDAAAWQRVAFCQFHDALPGSSIGLVYEQLNRELATIGARARQAAARLLGAATHGRRTMVFNALPVPRWMTVEEGKLSTRRVYAPALSAVAVTAAAPSLLPVAATRRSLDNGLVRAELDGDGQLVGLLVGGVALALSEAAGFVLYHDLPANFDAWDIDHYTLRRGERVAAVLKLHLVEHDAMRAILRGTATVGARSKLTVDYILEAGARHLRIDVQVDWHESHRLLKYHVPTAYRGRWARFGCPFGSIQRPQLPGVMADEAMWEVAASRWAAVTNDDGSGLAVLTEAKYGFSCRDGNLGISLLRSAKLPDPQADMGKHHIRFALGRHEAVTRGEALCTAAAADALFAPAVVYRGSPVAAPFELSDLGSLVPSWVLPAQRSGGIILRLHETAGATGTATLRLHGPRRTVEYVDFLERRLARAKRLAAHTFAIDYRPYQIVSLRIT